MLELVANQMEISAEFSDGFLCRNTGTVVRVHDLAPDPVCDHLIRSGRMELIPTITSQDLYLMMGEFTSSLKNSEVKNQLKSSLKGISAVWKFRNVLYHQPDLSEQWERFKNNRLRSLAEDWLSD